MGERSQPRDLYDIVNLYRRPDLQERAAEVRAILTEKCANKQVPVPTFASIDGSPLKPQLLSEWSNMLAHQLPKLPPFESYWSDLPALFAWLDGAARAAELARLLPPGAEPTDDAWSPPATVRAWGARVSLETIRFAAADHLLVDLGYKGSRRVIEPYALRRTKAGHLVLYALRADSREPRCYRVDQMESAAVTDQAFVPAYRIEFSQAGPIAAPPIVRPPRTFKSPSRSPSAPHRGPVYVLRCPTCSRTFRRTSRDRTMRAHHTESGRNCTGSGCNGILVETRYD
ncbi:MAG: WYL domain-containing protein [Planctomycetes bacterium]|nr:WYL domain-containing protein [Planctomycetota bacterium]